MSPLPKPLPEAHGVVSPARLGPTLPRPPADVDPALARPTPAALTSVPSLGPAASGLPDTAPFRASLMALADIFARAKRESIGPNLLAPIPFGVRFIFREQLQISLIETFVARFKRVSGYIATIKLAESAGTDTPARCQVISKMPWRYGPPLLKPSIRPFTFA